MQALRHASNGSDKARLDSKCKELIRKAEVVKEQSLKPEESALKQPTSNRKLTTREEIIILEGSKLNGFVFPPWKDDPSPEEFVLKEGQEPFTDSSSLGLSPVQLKTFGGWKRPWEAFANIEISENGVKLPTKPTMRGVERIDLVQDMTSDCSVVASLCAGSARAGRGHARVRRC